MFKNRLNTRLLCNRVFAIFWTICLIVRFSAAVYAMFFGVALSCASVVVKSGAKSCICAN